MLPIVSRINNSTMERNQPENHQVNIVADVRKLENTLSSQPKTPVQMVSKINNFEKNITF